MCHRPHAAACYQMAPVISELNSPAGTLLAWATDDESGPRSGHGDQSIMGTQLIAAKKLVASKQKVPQHAFSLLHQKPPTVLGLTGRIAVKPQILH